MNLLMRFRAPDCHRVRQVLQSYLDGELGEADTAMVAEHLAHCDRCGIDAEMYERVRASLAEMRPDLDPEALDRLRRFAETVPEDRPD